MMRVVSVVTQPRATRRRGRRPSADHSAHHRTLIRGHLTMMRRRSFQPFLPPVEPLLHVASPP